VIINHHHHGDAHQVLIEKSRRSSAWFSGDMYSTVCDVIIIDRRRTVAVDFVVLRARSHAFCVLLWLLHKRFTAVTKPKVCVRGITYIRCFD
jgi:hypothetical protein